MDSIDLQLLTILQKEGDATRAALARQVGLTAPAVHERLRKLREPGVIRAIAAELDPEMLGLHCLAFVLVRTDPKRSDHVGEGLARIPGVQEIHNVAGEDCFLVKVRCAGTHELSTLLRQFHALDAVRSTRSTIVLETVKESSALPLEAVAPAPRRSTPGRKDKPC